MFSAKISRIVSTHRYLPELDGLRALAILTVWFYHALGSLAVKFNGELPSFLQNSFLFKASCFGYLGVELFFTISGFLLCLPFANNFLKGSEAPQIGKYFFRRVLRIEPPYLASLIVLGLLLSFFSRFSNSEVLSHGLASAFYLHSFVFPGSTPLINTVLWSLEIEVQFYLLVPLLTMIFKIRSTTFRRGILFLSFLTSLTFAPFVPTTWPKTLLSFLHFFLAGMLVLDFHLSAQNGRSGRTWDLAGIGAVLCAVMGLTYEFQPEKVAALFFPLFLYSVLNGHFLANIFSNVFLVALGSMSYTLYLYHFQCISFTSKLFFLFAPPWSLSQNGLWMWLGMYILVGGGITLAWSSALFVLIEKPCMRMAKKLSSSSNGRNDTSL